MSRVDENVRMLVVEDDTTSRKVLRRALERVGCEVIEAASGEEALERFEHDAPDMVVMDLGLPGIDGYEATRRIKQMSGDRFVPVIFLTAETDDDALARCVAVGGDDFLTKPFSRVLLRAKIDALLRIRGLYLVVQRQRDEIERHSARLQEEQRVAEKLFQRMVGGDAAATTGVKKLLSPASIFNGDLVLVTTTPHGATRALLADFTGHGLSAAMGALPLSDVFYGMTSKGYAIGDLAMEINRKLRRVLPTGLFCACAIVDVDPWQRRLTAWNGGLPDVLVRAAGGGLVRRLRSTHLPLAVVGDEEFDACTESFEIEPGDRLYAYSDGLIEAHAADGSLFGSERLEALIDAAADGETLFEEIAKAVRAFQRHGEQHDDVTLLEVTLSEVEARASAGTGRAGAERPPLGWTTSLELGPDALRTLDPVPLVMQGLLEIQGLGLHREKLYIVLAELFSNALEHGVLGLDSRLKAEDEGFRKYYAARAGGLASLREGFVRITCEHAAEGEGGRLVMRVEDSGRGFVVDGAGRALEQNQGFSGRGIALVRSICDEVQWSDGGRIRRE